MNNYDDTARIRTIAKREIQTSTKRFVNAWQPIVRLNVTLEVPAAAQVLREWRKNNAADDEYLRARSADLTDLRDRVLRLLRTPKQQKRLNRTFAGLFIGAATFLATLRRAPI